MKRALRVLAALAWLAAMGCAGHDEWKIQMEQELNAVEEYQMRGGPFVLPDTTWTQEDEDENDQPDSGDSADEWTNWT